MPVDRRTCLSTLLQGTAGIVASSFSTKAAAAEVPHDLDIIDCHTHFYDPTRPEGVPWPTKGSSLYRTVLPKHLKALKTFRPLGGTVVIEASPRLEDNAWLLKLASDDPFVVGVVGHLAPGTPEFAGHLKRFAADPLFRGIRVSSRLLKEPSAAFLDDLKRLADRDLVLDVNGGPDSFAAIAGIASKVPTLRFVQNHIANVRITTNPPPEVWVNGMNAAAQHSNVFCKVSAFVGAATPKGQKAPTELPHYRPYFDAVWKAFGDKRLLYGSDWPVSERASDYATQQQLALEYVAERGPEALRRFCFGNSRDVYRWPVRPGRKS